MKYLLAASLLSIAFLLSGQNYYTNGKKWVEKAEMLKPDLKVEVIKPERIVEIVRDDDAFQGWKANPVAEMDSLYDNSFKAIKSITLDFGNHYTGYFSFDLEEVWGTSDAPTRFKLTFGEVPAELATPFDPYPGDLSRAWLQDEIITVMSIPATVRLDRRMAFRYLKIELLGASQFFDFKIADTRFQAVTSAGEMPETLKPSATDEIKEIDRIALKTLSECMQTVYEDGPKRDQRLWVGDLYLESLANTYTYKNHQLTQRCLYLLGGLSDDEGYVLGTVFETPEPHPQAGQRLMDYSLLYNVTLNNYVKATGDYETGNELWPVAVRQLHIIDSYVDETGLVDYRRANNEWWLFFDWKQGLNKEVAIQGLMIYALQHTYELAKALGKEMDVNSIPDKIDKMKKAAVDHFYNRESGLFVSREDKQVSYASQIWMVLADVLPQRKLQKALRTVAETDAALFPGGPYMYHYYIQALILADLPDIAREALIDYWGGMVRKGADTFWEVYAPDNDYISPYNFYPVNSYCHAWSCTPTYFIRKYPDIFQ